MGAAVTALTHPAAVCLHGYGSRQWPPELFATMSRSATPTGAVSTRFQYRSRSMSALLVNFRVRPRGATHNSEPIRRSRTHRTSLSEKERTMAMKQGAGEKIPLPAHQGA